MKEAIKEEWKGRRLKRRNIKERQKVKKRKWEEKLERTMQGKWKEEKKRETRKAEGQTKDNGGK